jgi:predicted RNA binding protein YcfA (HicA-like mRNA interferase family)
MSEAEWATIPYAVCSQPFGSSEVPRLSCAVMGISKRLIRYTRWVSVNSKQVIKVLEGNGWVIDRTTKHCILKKGGKTVPVPMHGNRDLPIGTLKSIERITGVKLT